MCRHVFLILPLLLAAVPAARGAPAPATESDRFRGELARLLRDLDSDRFEVRQRAAQRLDELVRQPDLGPLLAAEFQRRLVRADLSLEVRQRLMRWTRQLPSPPAGPPGNASPKELDELLRKVDDDSYAVRLGAVQRLDWLLANPKLVCPLLARLKQRLAAGGIGTEARRQLESVWQRARAAWLLSDPAGWDLPPVSEQQIGQWLDALFEPAAAAGDPSAARRRAEAAERELLDLLARDSYVPQVKKALETRLAAQPAPKLQALLDWTKPEITAEIWYALPGYGRHCSLVQNFLVGVPTLWPTAAKPVLFDRADERVAHCMYGNSLSLGDYPVDEAFPSPAQEGGFFFLSYLPTPRRRMAFRYAVETDELTRLKTISRHTFDHVLEDKRPLSEPELVMLRALDQAELSRFAGRYFLQVDDGPTAAVGPARTGGRPSRFGMICALLADEGTKDAMPGLAEAIAKGRFIPPNSRGHYRLHWIAALSIAARDPWPHADAWLAGQIGQDELLIEPMPSALDPRPEEPDVDPDDVLSSVDRESAPQVGATAAALLLSRHNQSPARFDLQPASDALLVDLHVEGYRFRDAQSRKKVQQWWQDQGKPAHPTSPNSSALP